jgi:hypothetical protein
MIDDGRACIAIIKQRDGCFLYYEDQLSFDPDEDVYYWNTMMNPASGIYGSIEDAERDARLRYGFGLANGTGT